MARVGYICNIWPQLKINVRCLDGKVRRAEFQGGFFETEDEEIQAGIERNNGFGPSIHWQDDPTEARRKEESENNASMLAKAEDKRQLELKEDCERKLKAEARAELDQEREKRKQANQAIRDQARKDVAGEDAKSKARSDFANQFGE